MGVIFGELDSDGVWKQIQSLPSNVDTILTYAEKLRRVGRRVGRLEVGYLRSGT